MVFCWNSLTNGEVTEVGSCDSAIIFLGAWGEIADLNYFGTRYYDGDIGLWTSVDPARQFWSPYGYVGNGWNPINGVDPDGNEFNETGLKIYNNAKANNFWGSKTLAADLTAMKNTKAFFIVKITQDDSYRGQTPSDANTKNGAIILLSEFHSPNDFEFAHTLRHEGDHARKRYDYQDDRFHGPGIRAIDFLKSLLGLSGNKGRYEYNRMQDTPDPITENDYKVYLESGIDPDD